MGPVAVDLRVDNSLKPGRFGITSQIKQGEAGQAPGHDRDALGRPDRAQRRAQPDRPAVRLPDHDQRRQHQPPPRRDPPLGQRVRDQRPGLHERHLPQRRTTDRPTAASTTATSSRSARSASVSRPPDHARSPRQSSSMPDSVLDILKLVLLVMLYLFFARVLFAVWSEVRQPANARGLVEQPPAGAGRAGARRRAARAQADEGARRRARPARRARAEGQARHRLRDQRRDRHRPRARQHDPDRGRHLPLRPPRQGVASPTVA